MANDGEDDSRLAGASPPRISVVIPAFNNAAFIQRALASVFDQGYRNTEIIVVDDGSTDGTASMLAKFSDQIKVIRQSNAGSAVARNVGLSEATGDYVAFLDADDWFLPGKFCQQAAILNSDPRLGAVHSGWKIADAAGTIAQDVQPWKVAPKLDLNTWLVFKPVKLGAMLFRRHWLQQVSGFDPELRQSQDVDLMLRLSLAGCPFRWQREPTLCYRHHDASTIRSNSLGQVKYATMVLDKFYANPMVPRAMKRRERSVRYYSGIWLGWHLFQTGNVAAVANQLQQTLRYSKSDFRHTVHDWLYQFANWTSDAGLVVEDLQSMIPEWVSLGEVETSESDDLAATLNWWLAVWWHYIEQHDAEAARQLETVPPRTSQQLVEQVSFYLRTGSDSAHVEAVDRFWQDALTSGLVQPCDQHLVTELYVTLCGRALYGGDWRIARQGLLRAVQFGWRPRGWRPAIHAVRSLLAELRTA
ncbi:Hyaluronan synthase [Rubripirellula lacrimiformis]|uniref:Hyaluronan synthase n=1 Tax=Rubripirellula lacrimiformis TaxID=1930273 RepID=A0A517NJI2_9BACT|nr:glycosyltransferase [Rubripirellula lacrimiformis]QDT07294.1 Hyaluronan synthase [Rubripirellula lacrimiformis]